MWTTITEAVSDKNRDKLTELGRELRELREDKNLVQREVGDEIIHKGQKGVTPSHVSNIERGRVDMTSLSPDLWLNLMSAYQMTTTEKRRFMKKYYSVPYDIIMNGGDAMVNLPHRGALSSIESVMSQVSLHPAYFTTSKPENLVVYSINEQSLADDYAQEHINIFSDILVDTTITPIQHDIVVQSVKGVTVMTGHNPERPYAICESYDEKADVKPVLIDYDAETKFIGVVVNFVPVGRMTWLGKYI